MADFNIQPATLDLASFIGCALARDTLSPETRALYHRIWSRMTDDAGRRVWAAYNEAVKAVA